MVRYERGDVILRIGSTQPLIVVRQHPDRFLVQYPNGLMRELPAIEVENEFVLVQKWFGGF